MISGKVALAALCACACLASTSSSASATELQPDGSDPNAAPPMPPPMPPPGTPGSVAPPPAAGSTEAHLQQSDAEDNKIGLKLFYLQPEIGLGYATLGGAIPTPALATQDFSKFKSGGGPVLGLGLGAEFITFQLGARLRTISTPHWNLWNLGGELMFQPGSGRFWPRLGLAVGYAWTARHSEELCGARCDSLSIGGLSVGARGGVQYFLSSSVEIGADATLDYMSLRRSGIAGDPVFSESGNGSGFMLAAMGHIGLHLP
jgi:hypothetical protein